MKTPKEIVEILDDYIIGQKNAKKTIAIALRNHFYWKLALIHNPDLHTRSMRSK